MSVVILALVAFGVSLLTFFSGFGLGTLLLPAFALFFPLAVAVAATAVVHLLNNLWKLALLRRHVDRGVLLRFGLPAVLAALPGAWLLARLSKAQSTRPLEIVMGCLILVFALIELVPALHRFRVKPRWLPLGGVISGFFGGLSGHQGALRAAFLGPLNLTPASFAGTQAAIACLVDVSRLIVYGGTLWGNHAAALRGSEEWRAVAFATLGALAGAWVGRRLLSSVTVGFVRVTTGILLLVVGTSLALGLVS